MNQLDHHLFKLKKILKVCQQIKEKHDVDVNNMFGIYFHNDDNLDYKETLCHTIINKGCCEGSLKQCSKQRSKSETSKKKHFYCQQHYKKATSGDLDLCIISPEILKKINQDVIQSNDDTESKTIQNVPQIHTQPPKFLRNIAYIQINGSVYYVNQRNLTVYDMDMVKVGKYAYDQENDQHIICDDMTDVEIKAI